ncbi:hypothetical protein Ddc_06091 [Ditylenchus destructor]|nr:hypothetical protein Ddc_06091 [Ditylenchus destructor]
MERPLLSTVNSRSIVHQLVKASSEVYVAAAIAVVEIVYKLLLIPVVLSDVYMVAGLIFLCMFPLSLLLALGFTLPGLCLPYLLYNFMWIVVYGMSSMFLFYELVIMEKSYIQIVDTMLRTLFQDTHIATDELRNVVYYVTVALLFVVIFGAFFSLNIQNVVYRAYLNRKNSRQFAKFARQAAQLARERQQAKLIHNDYSDFSRPAISTSSYQMRSSVSPIGDKVHTPDSRMGRLSQTFSSPTDISYVYPSLSRNSHTSNATTARADVSPTISIV